MKWFWIFVGFVLASLFGGGLVLAFVYLGEKPTTVTRLSPDETIRARLVERGHWQIDRNFTIQLEYLVDDRVVEILPWSPDEGRPEGTERLIWSKDGESLLLVGRHFYVKEDLFLDNGDQLYFLYQPGSNKGWINSAESTKYRQLKADQVREIEFTEPIVLRPAPGGLKAP